MALSTNREVNRYVDQELRSYPVKGSTHIYKGGFVNIDSGGYAQPSTGTTQAIGLAYEEADNSSGSDGDISARVFTQGDFEHALSGAAKTNIGDAVYASADDTLTFTSTANTLVGVCVDVPSSGKIILRIEPYHTVA